MLWNYILILSLVLFNLNKNAENNPGQVIDQFNGVEVYYNGSVSNVFGRNISEDGYNIGLLYQCVEFVKRYYYEIYDHKMPYSYGHAKDLFDASLEDGGFNEERALFQYQNGSVSKPRSGDIVVFGATDTNPFGHAGIICSVNEDHIILIQQNVGKRTRMKYPLVDHKGLSYLSNPRILGWLRKEA